MELSMDIREEKIEDTIGHQVKFSHNTDVDGIHTGAKIQQAYDASIDERLPETVTLLTTPNGGKLYLVGTAHFSDESRNDVATIIQAVQPDMIVVELCKSRINLLNCSEEVLYQNATNLNYQSISEILKEYGAYKGLIHIILYRMVAYIVKKLGMPPGGEFRTAFKEAQKIPNCVIRLADRSIDVTLQRVLRQLSWWEVIKFSLTMLRLNAQISKQDVERLKQKSELDRVVESLRKQYPAIEKTLITERDLYLTFNLQVATTANLTGEGSKPPRVVGVVGIGHVDGIVQNWGKVKVSDIWPIMQVPPQPLSSKILKFTLQATLLGAVIYMGHRIIPLPSVNTLQSIRSSIEGLLKVSAKK